MTERPTPGCLVRCENHWKHDEPVILMDVWDGGRVAVGGCAYPYCDPSSERMVAFREAVD